MIYESTYYNQKYLAHHGVKGMKWGVRKYQNPDGTLTAEGKKRYYDKYDKLYDRYASKEGFRQHLGRKALFSLGLLGASAGAVSLGAPISVASLIIDAGITAEIGENILSGVRFVKLSKLLGENKKMATEDHMNRLMQRQKERGIETKYTNKNKSLLEPNVKKSSGYDTAPSKNRRTYVGRYK